MRETPDVVLQAFKAQCEDSVPFPIETAEELLDLPKKSRERILVDLYMQDVLTSQPHLRNKPPAIVRMAVRQWMREQGVL